ncbi:hypothetical protein RIF29_38704 [Crotalaria pallida]|uniref:Uncharacterized protein n=1 Tax=Crotalaria pallida TaxID=3830 RepID=A0AAN9E0Q4_CROPI
MFLFCLNSVTFFQVNLCVKVDLLTYDNLMTSLFIIIFISYACFLISYTINASQIVLNHCPKSMTLLFHTSVILLNKNEVSIFCSLKFKQTNPYFVRVTAASFGNATLSLLVFTRIVVVFAVVVIITVVINVVVVVAIRTLL